MTLATILAVINENYREKASTSNSFILLTLPRLFDNAIDAIMFLSFKAYINSPILR